MHEFIMFLTKTGQFDKSKLSILLSVIQFVFMMTIVKGNSANIENKNLNRTLKQKLTLIIITDVLVFLKGSVVETVDG